MLQHAHGFARDFGADAVAGQNQNVQIHVVSLSSRTAASLLPALHLAAMQRGDLLVHQALLAVGQRGEAVVDDVQFLLA